MSYIDSRAPRSNFGLRGQVGGNLAPSFKSPNGDTAKREADNSKRTVAITLAALGAGAVGLYFIAGSSVPAGTPQVFSTVEQCVASRIHANGVCEAQWNEANKVHARAAPAYDTMQACEASHGASKCSRPATPDDAVRAAKYIPLMGGYFFGQTPEGTFRGVPLYNLSADGAGSFRIAELREKEPVDAVAGDKKIAAGSDANPSDKASDNGNRSRSSILFIPGVIARPSAPVAGAAAAPAGAMPASSAAPVGARPAAAVPAGAKPTAAAPTSARGGFGASARAGSARSGGG